MGVRKNVHSNFHRICQKRGKGSTFQFTYFSTNKTVEPKHSQLRVKDVNNTQQEKAFVLQKLTQMESNIYNLERKFELKMDNLHWKLTEQEKAGENLNDRLKEVEKEFREQCQSRSENCRADISKQLQGAEEIFKKEIFEKNEDCRAMASEKRILEGNFLQLNDEIQVIYEELEAAQKDWKLEKDELLSQIVAARQETEEIVKGSQMAEQAWKTDKDKFLSSLVYYKEKIHEMSMQKERALVQSRVETIEMHSRLKRFKARAHEFLEHKHFWVSEKRKFGKQCCTAPNKT